MTTWWQGLKERLNRRSAVERASDLQHAYERYLAVYGPDDPTVKALKPCVAWASSPRR